MLRSHDPFDCRDDFFTDRRGNSNYGVLTFGMP